jgi:N-sulfoglucosamine sulfohydrolase
MMMKKQLISLVIGWMCAWPVAAAEALPLNIVLFVTDDQSPIAGCYGSPVIETPHLDALAAEGVRFTRAYATTASCSASRSVILTGLQNHANGQYGHTHDFHKFETFPSCAAVSLPNQLAASGYRTAHLGKLHLAPESVYPFQRHLSTRGNMNASPDWVESCKELFAEPSEQPFFLCFWTQDPHRGNGVQEGSSLELKPDRFGNPAAGQRYNDIPERIYAPAELPVPSFLPDSPECREELAQYYQSVTRTDLALGRLVQALKDAGQWERTVLIFTADHGMAFPGAKTTVYEAGLHVPFIVRHPSIGVGGVVNDAMISHADITPSLLDIAGAYDAAKRGPKRILPVERVPHGGNQGPKFTQYHGRSWLPILGEAQAPGWDSVGASHTFHEIQMYYPMRSVRTRTHKLIWNVAHSLPFPFATDLWAASTWQASFRMGNDALYGGRTVGSYINRPAFELYDMSSDTAETRNLAADPEHAGLLEAMKERIKEFQRETQDPWIQKWKYE